MLSKWAKNFTYYNVLIFVLEYCFWQVKGCSTNFTFLHCGIRSWTSFFWYQYVHRKSYRPSCNWRKSLHKKSIWYTSTFSQVSNHDIVMLEIYYLLMTNSNHHSKVLTAYCVLGNYIVCKKFAVQTILWSLNFVIHQIFQARHHHSTEK